MGEPLVTIIISCYNHEKFVEDCLKSIYLQTFKNIELLIVDDASKDKSFEVIKSWECRLKERFINVIIERNNTNMGITYNLNKLIKKSRGYYIKEIASDDILMPNAIEEFVGYIERSDADVIYSNAYIINEFDHYDKLNDINLSTHYNDKFKPMSGMHLTKELCSRCFICAPAAFIPRKTFKKYGLYDEEISFEDWEYWLRISISGKIEYMDKITVYYRVREQSFSHFKSNSMEFDRQKKYYIEKKKILERYKKYCENKELSIFYNNELSAAIGIYNHELAKLIMKDINGDKLKVTIKNKIKIMLSKLHIYPILKKLKIYAKHFVM